MHAVAMNFGEATACDRKVIGIRKHRHDKRNLWQSAILFSARKVECRGLKNLGELAILGSGLGNWHWQLNRLSCLHGVHAARRC